MGNKKSKAGSAVKTKEKTSVYSTKLIITIGLVCLVGMVIIIFFARSIINGAMVENSESVSKFSFVERGVVSDDLFIAVNSFLPTVFDTDPIKGSEDASVTIIEYGNYDCIDCEPMNSTIKKIVEEYPEDVMFIWKDIPNASSVNAAFAGRCAQKQGKFWEMHDLLLQNTRFLNRARLSDLAQEIGLDMDKFDQCVDTGETASLIQENIDQAAKLEISGMPYFFINDQEISGTISYSDFKNMVELELEK